MKSIPNYAHIRQDKPDKDRLLPLRRFVMPGLYDMPYLSILVQRGKLKAEKIGRNYFTCGQWFREYMEKHADKEKWELYQKISRNTRPAIHNIWQEGQRICQISREKENNSKFKVKYLKLLTINKKTAVMGVVAAVFVFFGFWTIFHSNDNGRVAGESEAATSSPSLINTN